MFASTDTEYLRYLNGNLTVIDLAKNTTRNFPVSRDIMVTNSFHSYSLRFQYYDLSVIAHHYHVDLDRQLVGPIFSRFGSAVDSLPPLRTSWHTKRLRLIKLLYSVMCKL